MGEVVKVKDGYARNFLLRQRQGAARHRRQQGQVRARSRRPRSPQRRTPRGAAEAEAKGLDGKTFVLIRQAGESGQLYGSVTPRDIAEAATAAGVKVERGHVAARCADQDHRPLHGDRSSPHPEVEVKVTVNVARSADEADAQARGEDLTGPVSDRAEIRAAAEALFEQEAEAQDNA